AYPHLVADTVTASLAATASVPLRAANGVSLGAVGFGWTLRQAFGPNQLRRLDLIARIASQALERATLLTDPAVRKTALEHAQARLIQEAFLPTELPQTENLEVAAVYLPASDAAMGGDWYDVFPVDGGTCLVVGDVAGH